MKWSVALVVVLTVSACAHRPQMQSTPPEVHLEYGRLLDQVCTRRRPAEEFAAVQKEIRTRLDEFQSNWDLHGAPLLQRAGELIQMPAPFGEIRPALISCGMPSMSIPTLINVRHFVSAAGGQDGPEGHGLNNLIFHELLHRYVVAALKAREGRTTPLLEKYKGEAPPTRNHLHLYAIEQLTYEALGLTEVLAEIKRRENEYPSWRQTEVALKIVEKETAAAFVEELRMTP